MFTPHLEINLAFYGVDRILKFFIEDIHKVKKMPQLHCPLNFSYEK